MPTKPVFTKVLQVGIVVRDLEKSLKTYTEVFGIGPWDLHTMDKRNLRDTRLHGKPAEFSMKVAFADLGGVQLELIEPLDESIYTEFLRDHGEGIHHIAVASGNYAETIAYLKGQGIEPVMDGVASSGLGFAYLGTDRALACITEIYDIPADLQLPAPEKSYP